MTTPTKRPPDSIPAWHFLFVSFLFSTYPTCFPSLFLKSPASQHRKICYVEHYFPIYLLHFRLLHLFLLFRFDKINKSPSSCVIRFSAHIHHSYRKFHHHQEWSLTAQSARVLESPWWSLLERERFIIRFTRDPSYRRTLYSSKKTIPDGLGATG